MFTGFEFEGRQYIQHSGGLYWMYSYINKEVAKRVLANLDRTFDEHPDHVDRRLAQQFVQRVDLIVPCPKELDKDGSLFGKRSLVDTPP